jgi:hypothetical protein
VTRLFFAVDKNVFASRYAKPSGLALSCGARKLGFSPWGMPFHMRGGIA